MPNRLPLQRRGKGKPKFKSRTFRSTGQLFLPSFEGEGLVLDLFHDNFKTAPLMLVEFDGENCILPAIREIKVGETIVCKKIGKIVEGETINCVESKPGNGPKFGRSGGNSVKILGQEDDYTLIQLPSKKTKKLSKNCLSIVGGIGGGGRKEKPFLKAGVKFHRMRNRSGIWPKTVGSSKNPVDHPFGGGDRRPGRSKSTSRHAPAGRKVGDIAPKRTGRR